MDPLQKLLDMATKHGLLHRIGAAPMKLRTSMYADDTALFLRAHALDVQHLHHLLQLFGGGDRPDHQHNEVGDHPNSLQGPGPTDDSGIISSYYSRATLYIPQAAVTPWLPVERRRANSDRPTSRQVAELEGQASQQGRAPHASKLHSPFHSHIPHDGISVTQMGTEEN
jgi:hypothetical protein